MTDTHTGTVDWDSKRLYHYNTRLRSYIDQVFAGHPWIESAAICVAQYWDDEANDAVHVAVVFSQHDTPDIEHGLTHFFSNDWDDGKQDTENIPADVGIDHYHLLHEHSCGHWMSIPWDDNGEAIPLFASYCKEGAHQDMAYSDAYSVWAVVKRAETGTSDPDIIGTHLRPWLDGVRDEW